MRIHTPPWAWLAGLCLGASISPASGADYAPLQVGNTWKYHYRWNSEGTISAFPGKHFWFSRSVHTLWLKVDSITQASDTVNYFITARDSGWYTKAPNGSLVDSLPHPVDRTIALHVFETYGSVNWRIPTARYWGGEEELTLRLPAFFGSSHEKGFPPETTIRLAGEDRLAYRVERQQDRESHVYASGLGLVRSRSLGSSYFMGMYLALDTLDVTLVSFQGKDIPPADMAAAMEGIHPWFNLVKAVSIRPSPFPSRFRGAGGIPDGAAWTADGRSLPRLSSPGARRAGGRYLGAEAIGP